MQQILIILLIIPTYIYALYNPFFTQDPPPKKVISENKIIEKVYVQVKQEPRTNIEMTYIGYIESNKGTYALVKFNGKNIVVKTNDSMYSDEQIYKIDEITTNHLLIKDKIGRAQKVYFSSDVRR
jgi:hypothetical protein